MQKSIYSLTISLLFGCFISLQLQAQKVGILTDAPQAPVHVFSSGQVQQDSGLVLLGYRSEGHMELDFNKIQSLYGLNETPLPLLLQQEGGDVGIGVLSPDSRLHIAGSDDQYLTLQKTLAGGGGSGINLLRHNEFSGTDWRIINDGGVLRFYDGIDNFTTAGDLNMSIGQSGFLSLGPNSAAQHLDINGDGNQFIRVHTTDIGGSEAGIDLIRASEFSGSDYRIYNDGGVLRFMSNLDNFQTEGTELVRMSNSGNVGVGTASPFTKLHVDGGPAVGETGHGDMQIGDGSGLHLRFDNNEILARNGDNPSTLYFQYWSGNLSLCDDNAGRVGIGTSNPQAKLQIVDGTDASLAGGGQLVLGDINGVNIAMDNNEILARNNGSEAPLILQYDAGDVLMVPFEAGQVGIGITSVANLPSADYLLAVDGKIISEEVRVEVSGSWPDYVFHRDYKLAPLDQLEAEIQTLGHLPGMPAASIVETEGFDLGGMQKTIVEKIEELTLYMIKANKEIAALKSENENLKQRIAFLEK